jgi:16S rRNA (cytosine967-C5)-methyltransferase
MNAVPSTLTAVSPARRVAAAVLRRVEQEGAYADRALAGEAARAGLDTREHAFAMRLAYGAVQRRRTLDHVISTLAQRPPARLDAPVRDALRLGLLQLLFLDGVAPHAAVDQSVELAKAAGAGGARLVNAVLRRAAREGRGPIDALDDRTPAGAAMRHSVPDWLAELWWEALGAADARALLAQVNEPAETALRVNTLVAEPAAVAAELATRGVAVRPAETLPEALVLDGPLDLRADPLWQAGALVAQSRAAMLAARLLAPAAGMRVLDLCAAPGGKATMQSGEVVAVELHEGRARELEENVRRLGATNVRVVHADALDLPQELTGFDRALVDAPCSGLGVLAARPDLRWRAQPLPELQLALLRAAAARVKPGGSVTFSVCTLNADENEAVVDASGLGAVDLGAEWPEFRHPKRPEFLLTTPHRHGTSGFFVARLLV